MQEQGGRERQTRDINTQLRDINEGDNKEEKHRGVTGILREEGMEENTNGERKKENYDRGVKLMPKKNGGINCDTQTRVLVTGIKRGNEGETKEEGEREMGQGAGGKNKQTVQQQN